MNVMHVVGARPNFMKAAPVIAALEDHDGIRQTLVHTGQHYDAVMSSELFTELGLPAPDVNLGVGGGSHARQTADVMVGLEAILLERTPDQVLVYGDVNSTLAATLVSAKLRIPVAHVEAGLRAFDWDMPEEINRVVTDRLSSVLFTPSADADQNLLAEGIAPTSIRRVGNVMIDTLVRLLASADGEGQLQRFGLTNGSGPKPFVLVTLHRPSNVDDPVWLAQIVDALKRIAADCPVVFPVHPRTRARLNDIDGNGLTLTAPLTYLEFLGLQRHATAVITDSGGIQEETTYLGVPCLTLRENTERPVTITEGTNQLIGRDLARMVVETSRILQGNAKRGSIPELWDGFASRRIAAQLS